MYVQSMLQYSLCSTYVCFLPDILTPYEQIEHSSLTERVLSLQGELSKARTEQQGLTDQLNGALRDISSLKRYVYTLSFLAWSDYFNMIHIGPFGPHRKLDESGHKHQAEISDLKMQ